MKNFKFSRLLAAAALVACLSFTACKPAEDVTAQVAVQNYIFQQTYYKTLISGNWRSQYDGYRIDTSSVVYDDGGYGYGWTRTIVEVSDKYIYLIDSDNRYYAVSYKNNNVVSCQFSNAYKEGGRSYANSLLEAKLEFTIENGYYARYGTYQKQY